MHADWSIKPALTSPALAHAATPGATFRPHNRVDGTTGRVQPMGERLVDLGLLTPSQVHEVLRAQKRSGRPFGDLCERLFGISADIIEAVWMDQYREVSGEADRDEPIGRPRAEALALISPRQAWQFRLVPLSLHGESIRVATTAPSLAQASRFCTAVLERPSILRVVASEVLAELLEAHYPMGLGVAHVRGGLQPGLAA